jgi:hypothetical protein
MKPADRRLSRDAGDVIVRKHHSFTPPRALIRHNAVPYPVYGSQEPAIAERNNLPARLEEW